MSNFAITEDFERDDVAIGHPSSGRLMEVARTDDDEFTVTIRYRNGLSEECGKYSSEELEAIHKIISL